MKQLFKIKIGIHTFTPYQISEILYCLKDSMTEQEMAICVSASEDAVVALLRVIEQKKYDRLTRWRFEEIMGKVEYAYHKTWIKSQCRNVKMETREWGSTQHTLKDYMQNE